MSQLREGYPELNIRTNEHQLEVQLKANQYQLHELGQYDIFLEEDFHFLAGTVTEASEERLEITYQLGSEYTQSLESAVEDLSLVDRLILAQKLEFLSQYQNTLTQPYIHPANLFVVGDIIKVGHRGFSHTVTPYTDDSKYFEAYRAIVLYLINPKLPFKELVNGSGALKNIFSQDIQKSTEFETLNQLLDEQVALQASKRSEESIYVPKRQFTLFKWGTIVFSLLSVIFIVWTGIYALRTVPYQERLVNAEIHFTNNNFSSTIDVLKNDNPRQMPKGTQYALAVSAIKLDTLSDEQKGNILKNISMKTNENILLYWIYLGFGDYENTLDIAQNVGDNQLILHAYRKLYNQVSADTAMKGAEKQERLKEYREQIQTYEDMLEGTDDNEE